MKTAVLILAHTNPHQTQRLIDHLSPDFDVYVHVDKRSNLELKPTKNVYIYKKYKIYWGSLNLTMTTLFLLYQAHKNNYERYILISGQDLPIKSNQEIINFFKDNVHEYIQAIKIPKNHRLENRLTRYHTNKKYFRSKSYKRFFDIPLFIQRLLFELLSAIKPRPIDYNFYYGSNWLNLSGICVQKILQYLEKDKKFIRRFKWTKCSDEIFFQTLIYMIDGIQISDDNLRYIDWKHSSSTSPKTLTMDDYDMICKSGKLFARKFDTAVDPQVIDRIYSKINKKYL